jgi:hypothetical protein
MPLPKLHLLIILLPRNGVENRRKKRIKEGNEREKEIFWYIYIYIYKLGRNKTKYKKEIKRTFNVEIHTE